MTKTKQKSATLKIKKQQRKVIGLRIKELRENVIKKSLEDSGIYLNMILSQINSGSFPSEDDYSIFIDTYNGIKKRISKEREDSRRIKDKDSPISNQKNNTDGKRESSYRTFMWKLENGECSFNENTAIALAYYFTFELLKIKEEDLPKNITVTKREYFVDGKECVTAQPVDPRYFLLETDYINEYSKEKLEASIKTDFIEASNYFANSIINIFRLSDYSISKIKLKEDDNADNLNDSFQLIPDGLLDAFKCEYPIIGSESIYYNRQSIGDPFLKNLPFINTRYIISHNDKEISLSKDELELLFNEIAEYSLFKIERLFNKSETFKSSVH